MATRGRRPGVVLELSAIVDAALHVMERGGVDSLTMREVAAEVGVTPMALYHHVADKSALLDLAADAVLASVPLPPEDGQAWDEHLRLLYVEVYRQVSRFPGLARHLLGSGRSFPHGRAITNSSTRCLLAAGFDEDSASIARSTLFAFLLGTLALPNIAGGVRGRDVEKRSNAVDRVRGRIASAGSMEQFEKGLAVIVAGIRAHLPPAPHVHRAAVGGRNAR